MDEEKLAQKRSELYRIGAAVLMLLAVLTLGEYLLGVFVYQWWAPLLGVAVLKAFFILRDYMHLGRLFAGDEEAHE